MKVVKSKRNKSGYQLGHDRKAWEVVFEYKSLKNIPADVPLTKNAISHYGNTKNILGYANFKYLKEDDIVSILSEVKRQKCRIAINRWGHIAYYKLTM